MSRWFGTLLVACCLMLGLARAEAAQGVTDDTILIGAYGPITGPAAFIGLGGRDGMNLAVKEINAAGGVNGRKLKVIFEDDAFSPARALAAVKKLVDQDQVFMVFSVAGSNSTVGTIDFIKQRQLVMYVSIASAPQVTKPFNRYLFRGGTNETARYGEVYSEFLTQFLQADKIAILSGRDEYAKNEADALTRLLKSWYDVTPVTRQEFNVGDKDFTPQLLAIKNADPQVLEISANPPEAAIILRQARELGLTAAIFGGGTVLDRAIPANAKFAAEGVTSMLNVPYFFGSKEPDMVKWEAAWRAAYPDMPPGRPNNFDLLGYTDMYAVAEAMKRAGHDLDTDKFIAALESLDRYQVSSIASPRTFTAKYHIGNFLLAPMVVLNGRWVPLRWTPSHQSEILQAYQ
ncbi:MAG: ABC transporter substrate-binding protein [Acidisphaera sp.]|nr:ABC transporter substrate-binding protein [Acidisphaera sp.]